MKPKLYYISHFQGASGICKYSRDFYQLVLKDLGYIFMDSAQDIIHVLSTISSKDHVHIEMGIFQEREREILFTMLRANYKNVSVTLHDPPLLKFPANIFRNPFLNQVSKFFDVYINRLGWEKPYLKKLKAIYVLSRKAREVMTNKYGIDHVYYLPHVIDPAEIERGEGASDNFIFFGFIGRNKGIEYSLRLHQQLLVEYPGCQFYIAGKAMGRQQSFYASLRERFHQNVHYLGYVEEAALGELFRQAGFALVLFNDYRFFYPFSGSLLYCLKMGKIVLTNRVNTVDEVIEEGKNGFFLSGNLKQDVVRIGELFQQPALQESMREGIYQYLLLQHGPAEVLKHLKTEAHALLHTDRQLQ